MRATRTEIVALLIFCWAIRPVATIAKPYREEASRRGWSLFSRPRKKTPQAQLAYADALLDRGALKKAAKQYRLLARYWPEEPEAARAQYQYARLLDRLGKIEDAFDEYQKLFDRYPQQSPYEAVLQRQFEIAKELMNTRRGRFLIFPGFQAPERAIPLFEKIVANGPEWTNAPEAQFLIGRAHELNFEYEEAIVAYGMVQQRYQDSPFSEEASYRLVLCWRKLADEQRQNQQILKSAWTAAMFFLNAYPMSKHAAEVRDISRQLLDRLAKIAYQIADYYDRIAKKPAAAQAAYESCLREFPQTDWARKAEARLAELAACTTENAK